MAEDLRRQFPDLTQSVCVGILDAVAGDKTAAAQVLQGMSTPVAQQEKERKFRDLEATFAGQNLSSSELVSILEKADFDLEVAIGVAVELSEQKTSDEKRRNEEQDRRRREQIRREQARANAQNRLRETFEHISDAKIREILDKHEGDADAAADELLALMSVEADEKRKVQQEEEIKRERQLLVDALCQKLLSEFITEQEVVRALEEKNYNSEPALQLLLQLSEQKKFQHMANIFKSFTPEEVRQALVDAAWNTADANKILTNARYKRQTQEEEKKAIATAVVVTLDVKDTKAEVKEKPSDWTTQSIAMNKEVLEYLKETKESEKKQNQELLKAQLESRLRFNPSDLPGPLGMVPLTPKIIDEQRSKMLAQAEEVKREEVKESPVDDSLKESISAVSKANFELKPSADRVEAGDTITVTWTSEDDKPINSTDWVGLIAAGSPLSAKPDQWYWVPNTNKQGALVFNTPAVFGQYEFRFYVNRSYNTCAVSKPFFVGPNIKLNAVETATDNKFPRQVTVSYEKLWGKERTSSWVAMYPKSQKDNYYWTSYQWIAKDQKVTFDVPKAGEWEFRFFPERSKPFVDVARASLVVQGNDKLELTHQREQNQITVKCNIETVDPAAENAWIGIYRVTEENQRQYRRYKYITTRDATLTFKALQHSGTYEARLYVADLIVARSNPIEIVMGS